MFRWRRKQTWCCVWLKYAWESRSERSIYVYAEPPNAYRNEVAFCIAMRSVEQKDLKKDIGSMNVPVTLGTSMRIHFCPGCGVSLKKYYGKTYNLLIDEEILREHDYLQIY